MKMKLFAIACLVGLFNVSVRADMVGLNFNGETANPDGYTAPNLESGTNLEAGAVYRYSGVYVDDEGIVVDALLTLGQITADGDYASIYQSPGADFQISGSYKNKSTGSATMSFVVAGTGESYIFDNLTMNAYDIEAIGSVQYQRNATEVFVTDLSATDSYSMGSALVEYNDHIFADPGVEVTGLPYEIEGANYNNDHGAPGDGKENHWLSLTYSSVNEISWQWAVMEGDSDFTDHYSGIVGNRGFYYEMYTESVPEPATIAMLTLGALALSRKRRKN